MILRNQTRQAFNALLDVCHRGTQLCETIKEEVEDLSRNDVHELDGRINMLTGIREAAENDEDINGGNLPELFIRYERSFRSYENSFTGNGKKRLADFETAVTEFDNNFRADID